MKKLWKARLARASYSGAITVFVILFALFANEIVYTLAEHYDWYFYAEERYEHTAGHIDDAYYGYDEGERVQIVFCEEKENIEREVAYNLVYQTALQMQERYRFVDIKHVNIYLDPNEVEEYRNVYSEDGEKTGTRSITKETVIFDSGDRFIAMDLSDFFFLSSEQYIEAYNGEEAMAGAMRYVLSDALPIAYLTVGHGEQLASGFVQMLSYAGYDVRVIDLASEPIDPRASLVVCMYPLYDFEKAAEGSGIVADIEAITEFVEGGGSFYCFLDPYVQKPARLCEFLASYGIEQGDAVLRAGASDAVSVDGYSFMPYFADNAVGGRLSSAVSRVTDARMLTREVSPLVLTQNNAQGARVDAVLVSGDGTQPTKSGEAVGEAGVYPFAALAENEDGGSVFVMSGVYMTAQDLLRSDQRGNRDFFYALMQETDGIRAPLGATTLPMNDSVLLEGLSMSAAHHYTRILVLWMPLSVVIAAAFVLLRRKRR